MELEFIIIGQGICGTWLSYYLQKEKKSFLVIDDNQLNASSRISAGIINPVTGRRIVKTWMIDEVLPFAEKAYTELGNELNNKTISSCPIVDFFPTLQMREAFLHRQVAEPFLETIKDEDAFKGIFNYDFGYGKISPSYIVHLENLLPAWRKQLIEKGNLSEESFDLRFLKITQNKIQYKDYLSEKIIFCDGVSSFNNPLFSRLPFAFNKGEILLIEAEGIPPGLIYKKGIAIIPSLSKNIYRVGTNYIWDYENSLPTKEFRERTDLQLKFWLKVPFKTLEHQASVRPANIERRPFVGVHPNHSNIALLNGMGSKGCSLAPYFAKQLVDHLLYKAEITPEADIKRFSKILAASTTG